MITHELALELKNKGFPQRNNGGFIQCVHGAFLRHSQDCPIGCDSSKFVTYPTLEELIEACGERFKHLGKATKTFKKKNRETEYKIVWDAQARGITTKTEKGWTGTKDIKITGCSTKEEAVARLYLALNKK